MSYRQQLVYSLFCKTQLERMSSSYGRKFKTVPGKFSSTQWRAGNAARTAASARSAAVMARRAVVPGFTRTGGSYGRYGARARALGLVAEKKFFDTALAFNFDTTGEVPATGQITLIPQGDTESTRDGRKANIQSVQIRGSMLATPGAAANLSTNVYMYLVLDTQTNGAAAAVTDVFTSADLSSAMLNLNNSGRFRIIKKWCWNFTSQAGVTTAYNKVAKQMEFYKKCNIDVDWNSTTGAITEIRSNNLFLIAGADGNTDDIVSFAGTARLRFRG